MNKNQFATTPPMGWNSYDYYDTTVTEADVKANADYMAAHLKQYGWEYIVVDIEWYAHDAGSQRDRYQYIPFWDVEMDEYSRLLPERAPSRPLQMVRALNRLLTMCIVLGLNSGFILCAEFLGSRRTITAKFWART